MQADRFYTLKELQERRAAPSGAQVWRLIKQGRFPPPDIQYSPNGKRAWSGRHFMPRTTERDRAGA
jgi:hypothetical protein